MVTFLQGITHYTLEFQLACEVGRGRRGWPPGWFRPQPFLGVSLSTCLSGTGPVAWMEAVKNVGSQWANISWPLAALLLLCVEGAKAKCHHCRPHTFRRPAGLVEQGPALYPEASGEESQISGHPNNGPVQPRG